MKFTPIILTALVVATSASTQHTHQSNGATETGQSQFAAIAEIVQMLRDDPDTDWAMVDVAALRDHLVDMDYVTTEANVDNEVDGLTASFIVTGAGDVGRSVQRMVLAHSPILQQATGWAVAATADPDGCNHGCDSDNSRGVEPSFRSWFL